MGLSSQIQHPSEPNAVDNLRISVLAKVEKSSDLLVDSVIPVRLLGGVGGGNISLLGSAMSNIKTINVRISEESLTSKCQQHTRKKE